MLDIHWIRQNPKDLDAALMRRGMQPQSEHILNLDTEHRSVQNKLQILQTERNEISREVGKSKSAGLNTSELVNKVSDMKLAIQEFTENERNLSNKMKDILLGIPNLPRSSVPDGSDESNNLEIKKVGVPKEFSFLPKDHVQIGQELNLMNFETASKISGARFVILKGGLARLERALSDFMLDLQTLTNGYTEYSVPSLVRDTSLIGTGQLPKFSDDLFATTSGLWLIPTSEVPLTNIVREQIFLEDEFPMRLTARSICYRSEAGAAGKDTHGMIRQHQFEKVELVSIVLPDQSNSELERMCSCAEEVLKLLDLPYRVVELCVGDLGFSSRKTYDIEVWLPGQNNYREISSCSDCGSFQARRMDARFRNSSNSEKDRISVLHTLNGSGLAVGRTLVAVIENYQNEDGTITIPDVLKPFMNGQEKISADGG